MEITDAYNIALAENSHQQMEKEGLPSDIYDFLTDDLEDLWGNLSSEEKAAFENFASKNASLFEDFPEKHQTEEDMVEHQAAIKRIENRLYDELSFIID